MRILHLTPGKLFGGIENTLLTLARLSHTYTEWEPIFGLCFEKRLSRELRELDVPVYMLGEARVRWPWTVWGVRKRLQDLLERVRPDIVMCHDCWAHVIFAPVVRKRKFPLVFYAHNFYQGRHWLERWSRWTSPDIVLANSSFTLSSIDRIFPGVRAEVAYCPISLPGEMESSRSEMRRELRTPEDAVAIVLHSRLERWKGHTLLLDALGKLSDMPEWVCWITADCQRSEENVYLDELRKKASALGIDDRVHFIGHQTNIWRLLAAADIHCQPNTGPESFGRVFAEALTAQLPAVTTAIGAAPEIIDEHCGILVPPNEPVALADALLRLIRDRDLRARLGSYGPEKARQLCEPRTQIKKWVTLMNEIAPCEATNGLGKRTPQ